VIRPQIKAEPPPRRWVLDDGAVFVSRTTPDAYGVAVGVMVRTGTRDEDRVLGGISHLLEHMVFKGTARRTAFELARDMEAIGAHLDAYTTKEHTGYTVRVLPEELPAALDILAEMLLESTFAEDQLALEKQVVVEEISSSEDTPDDHVHELFTEKLLGTHPLSRPILGTRESVVAISPDDLRTHATWAHRGGNVILAAAGSLGDRELDCIARAFPFPVGSVETTPASLAIPRPGSWVYPKNLTQQYVEIGVPAVGMSHADRFGISLLANLLGGGMSSRLFQKVREEEGLAYSIYSYSEFHRDTGALCTSFSATPEHCQRALEVIGDEYERLRRGDVGGDEIEMNKTQLAASAILGLEGSMSQMSRLARCEMYYGRFVPVEEVLTGIETITRDDLVRIADHYLDPRLQTLVGHGPIEELRFPGI
jgi:predicted Zn-dependent peptidase